MKFVNKKALLYCVVYYGIIATVKTCYYASGVLRHPEQGGIMPQNRFWFKLDNAGKVFPGQNTSRWSNIFRSTMIMKEKVDPTLLAQAVEDVLPRFPCFDVCIKKGFFWFYLEKNPNAAPPVQPDINNPCYRVRFNENKRFLFRVFYRENRVSVEFFHALTDGYGATTFLCTLCAQYLRLCGHDISVGGNVLDITQPATKEELSDPFRDCEGKTARSMRSTRKVYHYRGTPLPAHTVGIITGVMPMDVVHKKAKEYGATVTEFLAAVLMWCFYIQQNKDTRRRDDISVQIPVSLRKPFQRESLRNFTLTYSIRLDPSLGDYTLEEIIRHFILSLRLVNNTKNLKAMVAANLKLEKGLMRFIPLAIKNFAVGLSFRLTGEHSTSVLFTNVGLIHLPEEMYEHVQWLNFFAGPGKINGLRCACAGMNGKLAVSFTDICRETEIEQRFFTTLVKMGIPVKIESNR